MNNNYDVKSALPVNNMYNLIVGIGGTKLEGEKKYWLGKKTKFWSLQTIEYRFKIKMNNVNGSKPLYLYIYDETSL